MQHEVFISYRRADTAGHAGRICDDLDRQFGRAVAFRDIDSIDAGADFVDALEHAIGAARVCIVLIGDTWLSQRHMDGTRRLDDPDDHVRREIELALANDDLLVLPVLVEGAVMPNAEQLPSSLVRLARLQAVELSDSRWDFDLSRVATVLRDAGVRATVVTRTPRWLWPLLGAMALLLAAVGAFSLRGQGSDADAFMGLWQLPNGSFWTVREKQGGLWIEETHYESREVWKRGVGEHDGDRLSVALELVFERKPFRYLHELRLSDDGRALIGAVRRSDRHEERSLVLTRADR